MKNECYCDQWADETGRLVNFECEMHEHERLAKAYIRGLERKERLELLAGEMPDFAVATNPSDSEIAGVRE